MKKKREKSYFLLKVIHNGLDTKKPVEDAIFILYCLSFLFWYLKAKPFLDLLS